MVSKALVAAAYQQKLVELARSEDIDVVAVVPPSWRDRNGTVTLERGPAESAKLIVSPVRFNGHYHLFHFPELAGLMRSIKPDILHMDEEPYNLATWLGLRQARQQGVPSLFFTWQNLNRRYPPPFSWMERACYDMAGCAIAGNTSGQRVLRAKGFNKPIHVIPQFGVDPDLFSPDPSRAEGSAFVVGYCGRLVPEKGVGLLIQSASRLAGAWRLEIVGQGPELGPLSALVSRLGIAEKVLFRGPLLSLAVANWMQGLDVVVLPSLSRPNWQEQFGRVLVEAMACQVPVVGSTCGEIPEVVDDAGLVFPEGDSEALADRIAALMESPQLRRELGERGRERVLAHYTHRRIAEKTYHAYRELLASARS